VISLVVTVPTYNAVATNWWRAFMQVYAYRVTARDDGAFLVACIDMEYAESLRRVMTERGITVEEGQDA
jgi:hypothetical protein